MRLFWSLASVAILVATITSPVRSELVVFGDSLSDTGNAFLATGGSANPVGPFGPNGPFPTPPYFAGRFSNGPVYVEYLAQALGTSAAPGLAGGTNFAFGFAETGEGLSSEGTPNIGRQIDMYFDAGRGFTGSEVVVLYGGANDILFGGVNDAFGVVNSVTNLAGHIGRLADAGAKHFLVPNLPDLGTTPLGLSLDPADAAGLSLLSLGFNSALDTVLNDIVAVRGLRIDRLDVFGLVNEAVANPTAYGLINVTDPAFLRLTGSVVDQPEGYLFWDELHPTATAHFLLGQAAIAAVPEPSALVLATLGIVLLAGNARRRARRR